jgi:putative ABC transport system permease protein
MSELASAPPAAPLGPIVRPVKRIGFWQSFARFFRELSDAFVQALTSLVANRLRAALTVSGIGIGVATVIGIYSFVAGFDASFARQLSSLGPNTLFVSKWNWGANGSNWWKFRGRPPVTRTDLKALQSGMTRAEAIAPFVGTRATVMQGEREIRNVDVRGTTDAYLETGGWQLKRGRFLTPLDEDLGSDACVIGADIEDAFFKNSDPLGATLKVGPMLRCNVIGTLVRKGNAFGQSQDTLVLVPLSAFERGFGARRQMTIAVVARAGEVTEAEQEIISVLRRSRRIPTDKEEETFSVNRQDKLLQGFTQSTMTLKVVALIIGVVTLLVGGIGIMNILLVSVKERTREIGVRRALGARRATILMQFLLEAMAVSMVGGVAGTLLGIFAAWFLSMISPIEAAVSGEVLVLGAVFSVVTGLLFGLWPAWSAAALHPIEALRYE